MRGKKNPLANKTGRTVSTFLTATQDNPHYPHIYVDLQSMRAHSLSITAVTNRALKAGGVSKVRRDKYFKDALSGDLDHCVATTMKWVSWQEFLDPEFADMVRRESGTTYNTEYWIDGKRTDNPFIEEDEEETDV